MTTVKIAEIKASNSAFYEAFSKMDYDAMAALWSQRESDVCIHPGWSILRSWREIRESWRAIFANTGFMELEISELNISIHGTLARVTCVENLFMVVEGQTLHSQVACTNLFEQLDGAWRIVLHHGSPIATSAVSSEEMDMDSFN